jgi:thiol-disulfide isomerase/thioredoxin
MRYLLAMAAILLCAIAGLAAVAQATGRALAPGDAAPELQGGHVQEDGALVTVNWGASKLTVVNFWATWCKYCKDQMPVLQQLSEKHAQAGLLVLGVFERELTHDEIKAYYEPLGVRYPVLEASPETNRLWGGIHALPTTFLVDDRGKILRRYVGATPEQIQGLVDDVEAVLEGRKMGNLVIPAEPAVSEPPAPGAPAAPAGE